MLLFACYGLIREIFPIYSIVIPTQHNMTYELSIPECKGLASQVPYCLLLGEVIMDVIRIWFKGYWRRGERGRCK